MPSKEICKNYLTLAGARPGTKLVDDQSAGDLELDEVFRLLDRTITTPGQALLYAAMRSTPLGIEEWERRLQRISFYREKSELRLVIRRLLGKVGREPTDEAAGRLFSDFTDFGLSRRKGLLTAWIGLTLLSFASPLFLGATAFLFIVMPIGLVNFIIYTKTSGLISSQAAAIHYIGLMAAFCGRSRRIAGAEGSVELRRLSELYPAVKAVKGPASFLRTGSSFGGDISDLFLGILKVFLLWELHSYLKAVSLLRGKGRELRELYETLGSLDAFCSLAELSEDEGGLSLSPRILPGSRRIVAHNAIHPLVEDCVPTSFAFDRGVVLTGTNMSGKSTFLRTLGINQLLATCLCLAYAEDFETDLFFVASSIRSEDDRAAGKSRYLAEAERLLSISKAVGGGEPPLVALIDEILNGTNSQDRIAASIAILRGAAGRGSIVVAATHDLEIAQALASDYAPYYFSERIEEGHLVFDYALREGIVDRKNALRLLRLIGFGDEVLGIASDE
jgi:Mismatch repair ATPase (MutS family)